MQTSIESIRSPRDYMPGVAIVEHGSPRRRSRGPPCRRTIGHGIDVGACIEPIGWPRGERPPSTIHSSEEGALRLRGAMHRHVLLPRTKDTIGWTGRSCPRATEAERQCFGPQAQGARRSQGCTRRASAGKASWLSMEERPPIGRALICERTRRRRACRWHTKSVGIFGGRRG